MLSKFFYHVDKIKGNIYLVVVKKNLSYSGIYSLLPEFRGEGSSIDEEER